MDADALRRRRWLTVVVMMATIMQALDGTIANVALPNIQGSLSATQEQVAWVDHLLYRVRRRSRRRSPASAPCASACAASSSPR